MELLQENGQTDVSAAEAAKEERCWQELTACSYSNSEGCIFFWSLNMTILEYKPCLGGNQGPRKNF